MKTSEYRYKIESIHYEITKDQSWTILKDQLNLFVDMAMHCGSGGLVLENWKIFLSGQGDKTLNHILNGGKNSAQTKFNRK